MKPQVRAMVLALAIVALLSGTVAAGHLTESVTSYTGCLVSKDGVIIKIKAGDAPSSPCSGGMTQVHFSGGDITSISVTGALTGGGDNGAITIGLKPEFTLPTGCVSGNIAEWNGSAWACGVDNDTTYSEGTGLDLTGTTFSIEPDNLVVNGEGCAVGKFVSGINSSGHITCAAPPAPPAATLQTYGTTLGASDQILLAGTQTILSVNAPAGTYMVFATVEARPVSGDPDIGCSIPNYSTSPLALAEGNIESIVLTAPLIHPGGAITLTCTEAEANVDIWGASLLALRIG
jgi:hypothetical protein